MAWLTGWTYRKKITIDETKVDADLTDFPVLVKLTSTNFDFSKARSDGYDIRFTSSDGTTLLKYERERHDATNQVAEYWVKIIRPLRLMIAQLMPITAQRKQRMSQYRRTVK